jgi:Lrp/AsnC family leucine-responsive transcriptional regulator
MMRHVTGDGGCNNCVITSLYRLKRNNQTNIMAKTQKITTPIDAKDFALLSALAKDGRASLADVAKQIHLSTSACARRQHALERDGLIVGYQALLDLNRLGLTTTVVVLISLDSQREAALDKFEQAVARCPSVSRCLLMSGTDEYLVVVMAKNIEDFEQIHRTQLSRLPGVARIQSSFAIREVVNRVCPPAALEKRS